MGALVQDLRYGIRMLVKNPGFTAVAVLTLALGIGANTAIFSLIDAVLLKMLPVQNPRQLVLLAWTSKGWPEGVMSSLTGNMSGAPGGGRTSESLSYPTYERIRAGNSVFSSVLAMAADGDKVSVSFKGVPEMADADLVSGSFFTTLGVQPILGRALTPEDDKAGASPVAVISYGYWQRRFGRDPAAVGKAITVNSVPATIVGVAPPEFYGVRPGQAVEIWLPIHTQPQVEPRWSPEAPGQGAQSGAQPASVFEQSDNWWLVVMGRLKPGATETQARAELDVFLQQSIAPNVKPTTKPETIPHIEVEAGSKGLNELRADFSMPLFILMGVVGIVLLIACANVANLLLARAASRQKEFAVRLAIGAGRRRLGRQLLTESLLLSALGGALGTVLAFWGTDAMLELISSGRQPITLSVSPDLRVLGFTAAVSILTGIIFGLSPAFRGAHVDLTPALKEGAGMIALPARSGRGFRLGKALVVAQVAMSLVLLVGAGLFVRTLVNLENVNAGFDQHNLLLFGIDPTIDGYKGQRLVGFYQELTRRLEALPGARSVSMSGHTLIGGGMSSLGITVPGFVPKHGQKADDLESYVNWVGPKFFETMGIPLVLGRTIGEGDTAAAPKVAVVNQEFVRQFLGSGNPLGRRFGFGDKKSPANIEVVGVVADAKFNDLRKEVPPTAYVACLQDLQGYPWFHFEIRTAGDPLALAPAVRRVTQGMDPNLALFEVKSQVEQIDQTLFQERLFARLTSFFGVLAVVLACVGVYGVMAFAISQRTHEIGIRMALGASHRDVLSLVLRETLLMAAIGIAAGALAAFGATRVIATLLYGLKPGDPLTISGAAISMVAALVLAGIVPARRAAKVNPIVALRYE